MQILLETYLNDLASHLGPMSVARRNEELREMRQHLQNAVIVNQEFGQSEAEAAANVVEQFGTPGDLGQSLVLVWQRGEMKANKRSFFGAAVCAVALRCFLGSLVFFLMVSYLHIDLHNLNNPRGIREAQTIILETYIAGIPINMLCVFVSGLAFPRKANQGTTIGMILFYAFVERHRLFQSVHEAGDLEQVFFNTIFGLFIGFAFTSLALVGARIGRRLRTKPTRLSRANQ